jgi:hypothetical protein
MSATETAKERMRRLADGLPRMQMQLYKPLTSEEQRIKYFQMIKPMLLAGHSEAVLAAIGRVAAPNTNPVNELNAMIRKFEGGQGA